MIYGSVCSGIEAATVAWHPLGWQPAFFSEIEAFPRSVLAHHYPDTPCHGDFTTIGADDYGAIDLLVGGTPCQSFSIAGLRGGMADDRGNLALEFLKLADRKRPRWLVWENVPGVLSSNGGRDFGSILGGLVELGYGFAYRVLDAQFFGVPQRRRRVFVVGHLGDWRRAAAVLFERHSLSGHPAPRREKGQRVADSLTVGANQCSGFPGDFTEASTGDVSHCLNAGGMGRQDYETETLIAHALRGRANASHREDSDTYVAHSLRGEGFDASEDGTGRGTPLVPVAIQGTVINRCDEAGPKGPGFDDSGAMFTLTKTDVHAICFSAKDHGADAMHDCSPTLRAGGHSKSHANAGVMPAVALRLDIPHRDDPFAVQPCLSRTAGGPGSQDWRFHAAAIQGSAVRRLTPRECERLQGFPDDYTLVLHRNKPAADGNRYKALGNSMAVPVMNWLGQRIDRVEALSLDRQAA